MSNYSVCFCSYHAKNNKNKLVMLSVAVVNLSNDELVESEKWHINTTKLTMEQIIDYAMELCQKYKASFQMINEPVPLEKCPCNKCNDYLIRTITSKDMAKINAKN